MARVRGRVRISARVKCTAQHNLKMVLIHKMRPTHRDVYQYNFSIEHYTERVS